jgi:competence protein ComEA
MMHSVEKENAMNRKRKVFLVIIFCMGVLCGCGSRNNVYLEKIQTETSEVPQTEEKDCQEEMGSCMVYVCGAVENPGVYELPENSRVYEAVAMAGGMTEDAGMEAVNQAEFVTDGQMLRIPTMEEVAAAQEESESNVDDIQKNHIIMILCCHFQCLFPVICTVHFHSILL